VADEFSDWDEDEDESSEEENTAIDANSSFSEGQSNDKFLMLRYEIKDLRIQLDLFISNMYIS